MSIKLKLMYILNRKLKSQSEQVFDGISKVRKKALDNWFKDMWAQLDNITNLIKSLEEIKIEISTELSSNLKRYENFCELLILDANDTVINSTYEDHISMSLANFPNFQKGLKNERYMY